MAITVSGFYLTTMINNHNATSGAAINLTLATHKIALFNNTTTPNFNTDSSFAAAPFTSNEVSGTGWAAGGVLLSAAAAGATSTAPTVTNPASAGTMMWDMNDVSVASTTLTNAQGAVIYADAIATAPTKPAIILINFGAAYSTVAGTFGITWSASGVGSVDYTP